MAAAAALALALAACGSVGEAQQQTWSFSTSYQPAEVRSRAGLHLSLAGYQVLRSEERFIEAERRNPETDFDVLRVYIDSTNPAGSQVRVQALTRDSRIVSSTALADGQALVSALMTRTALSPS